MSKTACQFCESSDRPITGGGLCSLCNQIRRTLRAYIEMGRDPEALMAAYAGLKGSAHVTGEGPVQ